MLLSDKDAHCYACGGENAVGLQVPFVPHGEGGSRATYTARAEHTGWKGVMHGGVTFALMDEALGWALYYQNLRGVTAKCEVRFRKPIPVGTRLVITAVITGRARRVVRARAEARRDGGSGEVMAELEATMYLLTDAPSGGGESVAGIAGQ